MKPTIEQIGTLLAAKQSELPDADYWKGFLCEFHQIQRDKALEKSGVANWMGHCSSWFSSLGPSKWAYGMGLAYATVTVAFFLTPQKVVTQSLPASNASYQIIPAPAPVKVEQLNELDLSPTTQGSSGEQVF